VHGHNSKDILVGKYAFGWRTDDSGEKEAIQLDGSMPNNGAQNCTMDGLSTTSFTIPLGYTDGGKVTFDDSKILEQLESI
jgi:hypothetical protein